MPTTYQSNAARALEQLQAGNARFVANNRQPIAHGSDHAINDHPIAIVLGCCDHRTAPETVFDQGLGRLFTIRVAGNVVTPTQLGSIELGAQAYGTRLIVVLGHQHCGAIKATLEAHDAQGTDESTSVSLILDQIQNAQCCGHTHAEHLTDPADSLMIANICQSVEKLRNDSDVLRKLIREDGLHVVGAYYNMESGTVEFLQDTQ